MTGAPTVLIMAKAPRPGSVKTRLHPLLRPEGCARLQAVLLANTVRTALAAGRRVVVAFDPPGARSEIKALISEPAVELLPQRGAHLGERMTAAADDALPGGGPLVVIGTDAPTMTSDLVDRGFAALEPGSAAALGPALDGGYYLLAVPWPRPEAFAIDPALWSGPRVMAETASRLRPAGRVELLPALRDLDTPDDAAALLGDPALPAAVAEALRAEVLAAERVSV